MLSGDIGRGLFAAILLTGIFGLAIPLLGRCVLCYFQLPEQNLLSVAVYFAICFSAMMIPALFPRGKLSAKGRSVLITGCDTGFGLEAAKRLHARGMHVFAGCLLKDKAGSGARELERLASGRMHVIQLNVTDDAETQRALEYVKLHLPRDQKGLWGIINNAGASAFGEVEWSSVELFKKVADVNLWGVVRCTKAFLPLIRRAGGRVVNMASGLSRMTAPSRSVYTLPKYAIQAFSDCLRYETRKWGVKVSLIEPGNYIAGTNIFTKESVKKLGDAMWRDMPDNIKEECGRKAFNERVEEMATYCNRGMSDLSPVLNAYEDALLSRFPHIRYQPMSSYWTIRSFIFTHFPACISDNLYIYRKWT